jgi:CRP/FNR family transcriptional regulator, cyclic AMP receptor protein
MREEIVDDNLKWIAQLKDTPALKFFNKKDLNKVLHFSKIKRYEAGEIIITQDSFDNWVFFLISGTVKVVKDNEIIDELRRTGDIFGEMCIIDGGARSASIYAIGEVICLATDVSFIDNLVSEDRVAFSAVFYQVLAEILANRLRETSLELVKAREEIAALKDGRH